MSTPTITDRVSLRQLMLLYFKDGHFTDEYRTKLIQVVRRLEKWCPEGVYVDMLNEQFVSDWIEREQSHGRATATNRKQFERLSTLWFEACRRGLTALYPPDKGQWWTIKPLRLRGQLPLKLTVLKTEPGQLRHFFRETFKPLKLRSRSPLTVRLYEVTMNNLRRFLNREALMEDLNDETISRYLSWFLEQAGGRSKYTANKERSNILAIWNFAARKRFVEQWPDVQAEHTPNRIPRAWRKAELAKLFTALLAQTGRIGGLPAAKWWTALHCVIWDTGERISAVLDTRWDWIDFKSGTMLVPAESRKGKREDRRYPLHAETIELLRSIRLPARDVVFPWDRSRTYVWNRYDRILKKAGLPHDSKSKFHRLRKSVASHGKAAGMDPQQLMGHSDSRVTQKYLDPAICGESPSGATLFRPLDDNGRKDGAS